ncbi:unnamed protein product [Ilex paraguariensis]|uniref:Uncharacterized protein n=1 Tax=Ilex paraguariensis TaxID=185542 RepID=A0ABC8S6R7_9AQUA
MMPLPRRNGRTQSCQQRESRSGTREESFGILAKPLNDVSLLLGDNIDTPVDRSPDLMRPPRVVATPKVADRVGTVKGKYRGGSNEDCFFRSISLRNKMLKALYNDYNRTPIEQPGVGFSENSVSQRKYSSSTSCSSSSFSLGKLKEQKILITKRDCFGFMEV